MTSTHETTRKLAISALADADLDAVNGAGSVWAGAIRGVTQYLWDHRTGTANDALLRELIRAVP